LTSGVHHAWIPRAHKKDREVTNMSLLQQVKTEVQASRGETLRNTQRAEGSWGKSLPLYC
jgi:hypothetical protein